MGVDGATSDDLKKIWTAVFAPTSAIQSPTFPATIAALSDLGVNRYRVDFLAQTITSYIGTEVDVCAFPKALPSTSGAGTVKWSGLTITKAIKKAQEKARYGRSDYDEFEKEVIGGGVVEYMVCVEGRKTIYLGVLGDVHVEPFAALPKTKEDAQRLREAVGMVDI